MAFPSNLQFFRDFLLSTLGKDLLLTMRKKSRLHPVLNLLLAVCAGLHVVQCNLLDTLISKSMLNPFSFVIAITSHLHLQPSFIPAPPKEDPTLAVKAIIDQEVDVEIPTGVLETATKHIANIPILESLAGPLYPFGTGRMNGRHFS